MGQVQRFVHDLFVVTLVVALFGVSTYTALSLTPIPQSAARGSQVAGESKSNDPAQSIGNSLPEDSSALLELEFRLIDPSFQLIGNGSNYQLWQMLEPQFADIESAPLEIYNPNFVDVLVNVQARLPLKLDEAVLVSARSSGEWLQLTKPGEEISKKIRIPARSAISINTRVTKMNNVNYPFSVTLLFKV